MAQSKNVERGAHVRFPPPLVFLGGVLLGLACSYFLVPAPVPAARTVRVAGSLLILAGGGALIAWAQVFFRRTGQSPIPWKPTPELLSSGPYRFTRNPMYVGMTMIEVGLGVALNNLWIALFAIPALWAVHAIAVLPEERYLTEKFGESYQGYLAQVRRYL